MGACVRDVSKTLWIFGNGLPYTSQLLSQWPKDQPILLIESQQRAGQIRYHKHKLVLIFSAMRHFAEWARAEGYQVDYHDVEDTPSFEEAWRSHCRHHKPQELHVLKPTDYGHLARLEKLAEQADCRLVAHRNDLFLIDPDEFCQQNKGKKHLLMETHYRAMRKRYEILLDRDGEPEGGRWNFDPENRKGYVKGLSGRQPLPPSRDPVVRKVMKAVDDLFADHPGNSKTFWWPVTRKEALAHLKAFIKEELDLFGPHQDAMAMDEPFLHHSLISPLLNVGLLGPLECIEMAQDAYRKGRVRLESAEAFIRQILGWREFIYGCYWLQMPGVLKLNHLKAHRSLPAFFWDGQSGMCCIDQSVQQSVDWAYAHHIQRLMVLANFCTLAGIEPKEVLHWFMELFIDAYEWVMVPNVYGMGLFADGGFFATKPYVSSGAYIHRMSNYCQSCSYDVKEKTGPKACPFNFLYWNFMLEHEEEFRRNPRMATALMGLKKLSDEQRASYQQEAKRWLKKLGGQHSSHEEH
jgi:deoxyribodipyrimidine photolyase-related protein